MESAWPRAGMARHFGIRVVAGDKDKVVGEIDADERHLNAGGIVHGGAYMAFADELGGQAAGLNLQPGMRTTTIESKTNFFRASPPGRLTAEAVPLHVGQRSDPGADLDLRSGRQERGGRDPDPARAAARTPATTSDWFIIAGLRGRGSRRRR